MEQKTNTMPTKLELIKIVSLRLFIAFIVLLVILLTLVTVGKIRNEDAFVTPVLPFIIGAIGGLVGLHRRLKRFSQEDIVLLSSSWIYALLPPLVGGILAMVLFLLILSQLLGGEIFPMFRPDDPDLMNQAVKNGTNINMFSLFDQWCYPKDYAKLFVWSFIAGFSERFVIDIINKFKRDALNED